MRVIVPFGPRKVQGFVIAIVADSGLKLRKIIEPMDIEPVLNEELLNLADWLTEQTLCYKISAFQVMFPPALKAKYEKKIRLKDRAQLKRFTRKIQGFFHEKDTLKWDEVIETGHLSQFQKEVLMDSRSIVRSKRKYKKETNKANFSTISLEELRASKEILAEVRNKRK